MAGSRRGPIVLGIVKLEFRCTRLELRGRGRGALEWERQMKWLLHLRRRRAQIRGCLLVVLLFSLGELFFATFSPKTVSSLCLSSFLLTLRFRCGQMGGATDCVEQNACSHCSRVPIGCVHFPFFSSRLADPCPLPIRSTATHCAGHLVKGKGRLCFSSPPLAARPAEQAFQAACREQLEQQSENKENKLQLAQI